VIADIEKIPMYKVNKQWIEKMKNEGYEIIDNSSVAELTESCIASDAFTSGSKFITSIPTLGKNRRLQQKVQHPEINLVQDGLCHYIFFDKKYIDEILMVLRQSN
jgi:hypothetical protein